jgi:branched-chain amino acid transport system substrate-binding protein
MDTFTRILAALLFLTSYTNGARAETVKVGWIGPLTGNAAVVGVDSAEAARLAFEKAAAKVPNRFELLIEDDQYDAAKTVTAYQKLVHLNHVRVLFVLTYGGLFAVAPLAEKDGVILIDPLDCNEEIARLPANTFCFAAMTEKIGAQNAALAHAHHDLPAAIIYFHDDPFMGTLGTSTRQEMERLGFPAVFSEGYQASASDVRPLVLRAKQRGVKSIFFYGYDELGTAMRQARALGSNAAFYATAVVLSPGFRAAAGSALEGTYYSVYTPSAKKRYQQFLDEFHAHTGRRPTLDISTVPTFDLANVIIEYALRGEFSAGGLRDYLYALKGYKGASGELTVDSDGACRSLEVKPYVIKDLKAERLQ